jgi:hypothetical protein
MIGFFDLKRSVFMPVRKKDYISDGLFGGKLPNWHKIGGFWQKKGHPFFIFAAHE